MNRRPAALSPAGAAVARRSPRSPARRRPGSHGLVPRAVLVLCALAFGPRAFSQETARPAVQKDVYVIGFSQCTVKEPWRVEFNRRLVEAARGRADVRLDVQDADDKTEQQVAQVRTFIRRRVDAILISPREAPGLTGVVQEAVEAGIPVVVLDRDVLFAGYDCFVGADNRVIGRAAGRTAVDLLGGPGRARGVVYEICGGLASTPAQERRAGFHDVVEKEAGITIIGGLDGDWKKDRAQTIFQDALKANPRIDLVYAHNDPMAHGAYQAARAAGRQDEMKFIGIDALPDEGLRWVRMGELTATVAYPTPGEEGLEMALKILRGESVPKRVTLATRVYTRENVDTGGAAVADDAAPTGGAPGGGG